MFALVSLARARRHLQHDTTDHDLHVQDLIYDASAIVMDFLKLDSLPDAWNEPAGSPSGSGVPKNVQAACLLMVGELDRNRSAAQADLLSASVRALLERLRDPSIA